MPKPKPLHNEFELAVIAGAVKWTAFVQLRPLERIREERNTREEAEEVGALMAEHYGRGIMIYAINAAGRSALATTIPAPSRMPAASRGL